MAAIAQRPETRVAGVAGSIYLLLFPLPVVCFLGALATDLAYAGSALLMWLHFSQWLLAAGLAFGAIAAVVLAIEFIARPVLRTGRNGWTHLALFYASLIAELFNAFVHTADGWTAVVPMGLILSVVGTALALGAVGALIFIPVAWIEPWEDRP